MARRKSSQQWLARQRRDPYVKQAQAAGWRSRAAYKLLELDQRDSILKQGLCVLDLGAAPGGWSQVAAQRVGSSGRVIAVDVLEMPPLPGVEFLCGDLHDEHLLTELTTVLGSTRVDLVLSDMAPNMSGVQVVDQARTLVLGELVCDLLDDLLRPGGTLVLKTFHGEGFDELMRGLKGRFRRVVSRKPAASRAQSREVYLVAQDFRG